MNNETFINSINLNARTDFPYLVLDGINGQSYPRTPGFQVMHWHEDLEFTYLTEGFIEVQTLVGTVPLHPGEGVFVNKNVVHRLNRSGPCHYRTFIFPDYFLSFYPGGPARALVERTAGNSHLPLFHFTPAEPWQARVLSYLKRLFLLEQEKTDFYPYEALCLLTSLWLEFQKNITPPTGERTSVLEARMRVFLQYIREHYAEAVTLEELSASAHVSKSECLRCFRQSLETTPYKYLSEFRLSKAAQLLRDTDRPISEISAEVGFQQLSHFGKCFREKAGCSPRAYRAAERAASKEKKQENG